MSGLAKVLTSIGIFFVSLLPFWVVSIMYVFAAPADFWQPSVVIIAGGALCGGLQITLLVIALVMVLKIVTDDFRS